MTNKKSQKVSEEMLKEIIEKAPEIRPGYSDSLGSVPYLTVKTKDGRTKHIPERSIVYID